MASTIFCLRCVDCPWDAALYFRIYFSCRYTTATTLALSGHVAPSLITKAMRQKRGSAASMRTSGPCSKRLTSCRCHRSRAANLVATGENFSKFQTVFDIEAQPQAESRKHENSPESLRFRVVWRRKQPPLINPRTKNNSAHRRQHSQLTYNL